MGGTTERIGESYTIPDWDDLPDGIEHGDVVDEIAEAQRKGVWEWWKTRGEPLELLYSAPDEPQDAPQYGGEILDARTMSVERFQVGDRASRSDEGVEHELLLRFSGKMNGQGPVVGYQVAVPADQMGDFVNYVTAVAGMLRERREG